MRLGEGAAVRCLGRRSSAWTGAPCSRRLGGSKAWPVAAREHEVKNRMHAILTSRSVGYWKVILRATRPYGRLNIRVTPRDAAFLHVTVDTDAASPKDVPWQFPTSSRCGPPNHLLGSIPQGINGVCRAVWKVACPDDEN